MNKTAIASLNPAAGCPAWCTATHERDWITPRANGNWNVLHQSDTIDIRTDEHVAPGVATDISVTSESYICQTPSDCHPRQLWLQAVDTFGNQEGFALTARQALRLAEVLVQQAAAALAEETTTTAVTR